MELFNYKAIDVKGVENKGIILAHNNEDAQKRIRDLELFAMEVKPIVAPKEEPYHTHLLFVGGVFVLGLLFGVFLGSIL